MADCVGLQRSYVALIQQFLLQAAVFERGEVDIAIDLDLAISVPNSYIEMIYDCAIQLTLGLEFAHNNGLVHGQFDLSNVVIGKDRD